MLRRQAMAVALGLCLATAGLCAGPVQLTTGPADDTEAAWSPDGRTIAFERCRGADRDLWLLDLASGRSRCLVGGPGRALYPAWSPDSRSLVYCFGHVTATAVQPEANGYNLFRVAAAGGPPARLTSGLVRDYTPSFAPAGDYVYFSSTRGSKEAGTGLWRLPAAGGEPEPVLPTNDDDDAAVQPVLSPDGRLLAYARQRDFRTNWCLRLAKVGEPGRSVPLTPPEMSCYAPRWSPDGRWLACTGFRVGDAGWGVYLVHVRTGTLRRLATPGGKADTTAGNARTTAGNARTAAGNARSPAWSPDGKQLVFESNAQGPYHLYRIPVKLEEPLPAAAAAEDEKLAPPVISFDFALPPGATVPDQGTSGNTGTVAGTLEAADGAIGFEQGGYVRLAAPRGCDFGSGDFTVEAEVVLARSVPGLRLLAVGHYPDEPRGWQLYLADNDKVWFSARTPDHTYVGACSDGPLPQGVAVVLRGMRRASGRVELYVDGLRQQAAGAGGTMNYPAPVQVRLGQQFDGSAPALGLRLRRFAVYRDAPPPRLDVRKLVEDLLR